MTVTYRIDGADFSGQGVPNTLPFLARNELVFGYDFANRADRLSDISGNHGTAVAMRNNVKTAVRTPDPTVIKNTADGLGITVEMGYIDTLIPTSNIALTDEFTIMIVGGYSSLKVPDIEQVGNTVICSLLDLGTGISPNGLSIEYNSGKVGARIKGLILNLATTASTTGNNDVMFLTRRGNNWILDNKTRGTITTKTDTQLGLTADITPSSYLPNITMGHFFKTATNTGLYPRYYQVAKWSRALTDSEMDEQYLISKSARPTVGL